MMPLNRINIYACFVNIYVPHEVKNQRALAKRTSQILKNEQDVNTQMRSGTMNINTDFAHDFTKKCLDEYMYVGVCE